MLPAGFVENDELGIGGQRTGDFEQALVAVGQAPGLLGIAIGKADELQLVHGPLKGGPLLAALRRGVEHGANDPAVHPAMAARKDVLHQRQRGEQADGLERPGNAEAHDGMRLHALDGLPGEPDVAAVRNVVARDQVEHRGLARHRWGR